MPSPASIKRLEQILFSPPPGELSYDLYAILDGAAVRRVPDFFEETNATHGCLFRGETDPAVLIRAPWLVRLEAGSPVLEWLLHDGWGKNWGIYALVPKGREFDDVLRHFRQFVQVALPDSRIVYFRLYDPRILRLFLPTCDAEQNAALFAVPRFLVCEDTDPDKLLLHSENDGNATLRSLPLVGGVAAS